MQMFIRLGSIVILAMTIVAGCAGPSGDVRVRIVGPDVQEGESALRHIPPKTFMVEAFREDTGTGVLPGRIGERKTVGDISLGMVTIDPPPGRLVERAFAAELRAAGHRRVEGSAAVTINGVIKQFNLRTDVTALYWDVILNSVVSTTVRTKSGDTTREYAATCKERTYVWPGEELIARVVASCVSDMANQFRNDETIVHRIGSSA